MVANENFRTLVLPSSEMYLSGQCPLPGPFRERIITIPTDVATETTRLLNRNGGRLLACDYLREKCVYGNKVVIRILDVLLAELLGTDLGETSIEWISRQPYVRQKQIIQKSLPLVPVSPSKGDDLPL